MRLVYHLPLSPFSRKIRLLLSEKGLPFELCTEDVWERRDQFLLINPTGEVPVLVERGAIIADSTVISEYLEEVYPTPFLIGETPLARAETRRLAAWFDLKFYREVTRYIAYEKMVKRLEYIGFLTSRRNWLAGSSLTCADLAAGAQLSVIDYLGDVPWCDHSDAKNWYARLKSRPSFQPLLEDSLPGVRPSKIYADLDF